jgi:DmsE family decaheme c-type cytochrome
MRAHLTAAIALLCFVGLSLGSTRAAPQVPEQTPPVPVTEPAAEPEALPSCGDCHEQAKSFAWNAHAFGAAKKGQVESDSCAICHGDGTAHIEGGGDKAAIEVPRGLEGADGTCRTCHDQSTDRISHRSGVHANSPAVNCLSCHAVHSPEPKLLAKNQLALCSNCHSTQAASFRNKAFAHRLGHGGMECSSCHEPHGRPGKETMRAGTAGESACLTCHTEKRGPYVFAHGGSEAGECVTCHEAHGSSNPKQLKRAVVSQLCVECHSPIALAGLGSQPPSFHNLSDPRYQNCTSCHVAIHGSNRDPQLLK